jgi:hypothetical protein
MALDPQLAAFVGTWHGDGTGTLPGMPAFGYEEEIRFEDLGRDVAYLQRAWDPASGQTLHAETGIWRVIEIDPESHVLVATFSQPRRTEVAEGPIRAGHTLVVSTKTAAVRGAKGVTTTQREYRVLGNELTYEFWMATRVFSTAKQHPSGTLRRVAGPPSSVSRS